MTDSAGTPRDKDTDLARDRVDQGEHLTSNQGVRIDDDQNSLTAGARGPTLMEDFHLREKITHFDHERIPERIVHARGAAAHGYFEAYEPLTELTKAAPFQQKGKRTPVFVRFSTVAGSRGSADTPRDVRGFAVKFYTDEGVWDLVGNNIPVFFIQDAIKFPDLIHAVKPEPHNEIPQAQSAHDTFYDFASLTPEMAHMMMWVMSDRAIPRSFSTMEGFGVHTFRLVNAAGKGHFVKFHWKPIKGVHSLVWDEAQKVAGKDPDYNRRDLFEAIERGDYPEWEMGIQVIPEEDEHKYDFDLLDPTKIVPEEDVPVRRIGKMVLNRNPDNYFAETEQVAFHPGHVVPGIDFTNDPLLQGRLFSYIDTQLRRVGPNFAELPINRPINPVHNNQRDGMARQTINKGRVAYYPNSIAKGCPMHSPEAVEAFTHYAEKVDGAKIKKRSESFADHFGQATLFWNSMADWEKQHIVEAFSFELNMVDVDHVRARFMNDILVNIHEDLAQRVSRQTGIPITATRTSKAVAASSPALSMANQQGTVKGRKLAVLAGPGVDGAQVSAFKDAMMEQGADVEVISAAAGTIQAADGSTIEVDRAAPNAPPVIYDAVFVPGGDSVAALLGSGLARAFVTEQYAHRKLIAAAGNGVDLLKSADFCRDGADPASLPGVIVAAGVDGDFLSTFTAGVAKHRVWERSPSGVAA